MPPTSLRRLLADTPGSLVVPTAYDMVSALLIARAGFPALFMSGYGHAASHLGLPDAGYLGLTDMLQRAQHTCRAVPQTAVLVDADTGYGGVANVRLAVQEYERAGAAAIMLEDQEFPKKCGHTPGKRVVPADDHAYKIQAAVAARTSPDLAIIARTDARAPLGLDEAIRRGRLYAEAGADIIFVEAPQSMDELRAVGQAFGVPAMANVIEGGLTPQLSAAELGQLGFKLVIFGVTTLMAAAGAVHRALTALRETGDSRSLAPELMPFGEFDQVIGFPAVREWEARFGRPAGR